LTLFFLDNRHWFQVHKLHRHHHGAWLSMGNCSEIADDIVPVDTQIFINTLDYCSTANKQYCQITNKHPSLLRFLLNYYTHLNSMRKQKDKSTKKEIHIGGKHGVFYFFPGSCPW
jgi:hypothetical protein